jgi:glycosyltransferase involved in cell wall biosynthesis
MTGSAGGSGVNFYSPIGVLSGLGSAGRGYLAALRAAAIPVSVVPVHELFAHKQSVGRYERRQTPSHPISIVHVNADTIPSFLHYHARSLARARYKIAIWVWELPAFRDEWAKELRHFDEIWTPSTFCRRAIEAMTSKPVTVAPHVAVGADLPEPASRETFGIGKDEFAFLYMFDGSSMVERKNPRCLVDAFQAAFSPHDPVRLVLKASYPDRELSEYLDRLAASDPRCVFLRDAMRASEIAGLIRACDCYVSPHRSEGFGLTVAEAMALGSPVIATDYGGTADFVTDEVGFPLRCRLVEVDRDHGPYPKGAIWADPSREHLCDLLRYVVAEPAAAADKGRRARARMLKAYSAAAIGGLMRERLDAIATGQGRRS